MVKSLSGRFPDEIEYFDPSILLQFDRGRVPNPFLALWRSLRFFMAELRRGNRNDVPIAERQERYDRYLRRVDDVISLIPKGWFSLAGLEAFLRRNLSNSKGRLFGFDHLRTDLFICATHLSQGRAVLFGKKKFAARVANTAFFSKHQYIAGETLAHAILCSSAIPFLFVPHGAGRTILADGDVRNTAAIGVVKSLVDARFIVTINPLVPLPQVGPAGSTLQLFLQTLLAALEGNVVATLKLEFEEKYRLEAHHEPSFDIIYFRPSPDDMKTMTGDSVVNLFRYRATNAFFGYRAVFETMRDHPEEAKTILERYGYGFRLAVAERRYTRMQRIRHDLQKLEDTLLTPRAELLERVDMKTLTLTNEYPPYVYGGAGVHVEFLSRELAQLIDVEVRCFGDQHSETGHLRVRGYGLERSVSPTTDPQLQPVSGADSACASPHRSSMRTSSTATPGTPISAASSSSSLRHPAGHHHAFAGAARGRGSASSSAAATTLSCWVEHTALEMADAVIAVSQGTSERHRSALQRRPGARRTSSTTASIRTFTATGPRPRRWRATASIPQRPYVLFVGRITRQKGIVHLVQAIRMIPDMQIVLCAGAPDTPEIAAEMTGRCAADAGAGRDVVWIREMVAKPTVIELYSHAAVFCCPSIYEPSASSIWRRWPADRGRRQRRRRHQRWSCRRRPACSLTSDRTRVR